MRIKLVVVGGEVRPSEFSVSLPVVIGRGKEATFPLLHRLVSRAHCRLFEEEGKIVVEDLKSLNGTFANNRRIQEPTILVFGQLLTIGDVTFRVMHDGGSPASSVPAETVVPSETDVTVHAPTAKAPAPDFTVAEEEIPAGELVEEGTEEAGAPQQPLGPAPSAAPKPGGIPNLPKFETKPRRRF